MAKGFESEDTLALQEQRLSGLRRQAARGERHVVKQLKRTEREYVTYKRRLDRIQRSSNGYEGQTGFRDDIESALSD